MHKKNLEKNSIDENKFSKVIINYHLCNVIIKNDADIWQKRNRKIH